MINTDSTHDSLLKQTEKVLSAKNDKDSVAKTYSTVRICEL